MVGIVDVLVFCKGRERLEGRDVAYVVLEGVLAMHILSELAIFHVCIYMEQSIHVDTFDFDIPTFMVRQRLRRGKTSRERVLENESTPEAHTSIWSRTVVDLVIERDVNGAQDMLGYLKENVPVQRLVVAAILMIAGQVLNAVTSSYGYYGVYYGFKLGRTVPWCTKFPFNVGFRHPQYLGRSLPWAIAIVLLSSFPSDLLQNACLVLSYCVLHEETGGESDDTKKKK